MGKDLMRKEMMREGMGMDMMGMGMIGKEMMLEGMLDSTSHLPVTFKSKLTLPQVAEYTTRLRQFGQIAKAAKKLESASEKNELVIILDGLRELGAAFKDLAT